MTRGTTSAAGTYLFDRTEREGAILSASTSPYRNGLKYIGPFPITGQINLVVFELQVLRTPKIHLVFYMFKLYTEDTLPHQFPIFSTTQMAYGQEEYLVKEILN